MKQVKTFALLILLSPSAAHAQLPPIVYIAGPHGHTSSTMEAGGSIGGPYRHPNGCDLKIRWADGTIETLVVGSQPENRLLSVTDPCPSLDGQSVYYAHYALDAAGRKISDIWRIELGDRLQGTGDRTEPVRLTDAANEWDGPLGAGRWAVKQPVWNTAPCEIGGRIVFTSNRTNTRHNHDAYCTFQLYAMDPDGRNVEKIGHLNLGGALHPTAMKDGSVAWSSAETQGLRPGHGNGWGIWSIYPDGGHWGPLFSSLGGTSNTRSRPIHFQAETSDGSLIAQQYYDTQISGLFPVAPRHDASPFGPPTMFGPADYRLNPPVDNGAFGKMRFSFQRLGLFSLFPQLTSQDRDPKVVDGQSVGTVGHPAAAPENGLLFTWRQGPKAAQTDSAGGEIGICYVPDVSRPYDTSEFVKVVDEPGVMECFPKFLGPYSAIHGIAAPPEKHYRRDEHLPEASPLTVVGTSSLDARETKSFQTLATQGGDYGVETDQIEYIGILLEKPLEDYQGSDRLPHMTRAQGGSGALSNYAGFGNQFNERVALLEPLIPLTKRDADGNVVLDPSGQRDTSFAVEIPANQPWTFAYFDAEQNMLGMAQTWHQGMPGEVRTDCGGCHAHNQPAAFAFDATFAASPDYERLRLVKSRPVVEYWTDVRPIFEAHGVKTDAGAIHTRQSLYAANLARDFRSANAPLMAQLPAAMTAAERQTVSLWIATGMTEAGLEIAGGPRLTHETMRGPWGDTNPPTLVLVPERRPAAPVTQIVVGACDTDSGLREGSLSVRADWSVNGRAAGEELIELFTRDEAQSTWSLELDAPVAQGEITASIRDKQQAKRVSGAVFGAAGNETRIVRSFVVLGSERRSAPVPRTASAGRAR